jgi:hypothetical protein
MKNFFARSSLIGFSIVLVPLLIIQAIYIVVWALVTGRIDIENIWFITISEWLVKNIFKVNPDELFDPF